MCLTDRPARSTTFAAYARGFHDSSAYCIILRVRSNIFKHLTWAGIKQKRDQWKSFLTKFSIGTDVVVRSRIPIY